MRLVLKTLLAATVWATIWAALALILGLIPGVQMGVLLLAMLPLWMLNDAGVEGLGHVRSGFFIPTEQGLAVALGVLWVLCLVLMWVVMLLKALWRGPLAEEPWWKKSDRRW